LPVEHLVPQARSAKEPDGRPGTGNSGIPQACSSLPRSGAARLRNEKLTYRKGSLVIAETTEMLNLKKMALTAKAVRPFRSI
jgi:hypothetical protein